MKSCYIILTISISIIFFTIIYTLNYTKTVAENVTEKILLKEKIEAEKIVEENLKFMFKLEMIIFLSIIVITLLLGIVCAKYMFRKFTS